MTLKNIVEGVVQDESKSSYAMSPDERIGAMVDLFVHMINHYHLETNQTRILTAVEQMLKSKDMVRASQNQRAMAHHIAGISKFVCGKVKYSEVKMHLKNALMEAQDPELLSKITFNLAVLNYCELQDHNERVQNQGGEVG